MNALRHYVTLMRRAEARQPPEGYTEKHHIFPKSIFGKNNRMVVLTAREHYVAHLLLWRVCKKRYGDKHRKTQQMASAIFTMSNRLQMHSHHYAALRAIVSDKSRKQMTGVKMSKETRHKMSVKMKDPKRNPTMGKGHTEEAKQKMRDTGKPNARKTRYYIHPDGHPIVITNLKQYCLDHNLNYHVMINLHNGYDATYKGYKKDLSQSLGT